MPEVQPWIYDKLTTIAKEKRLICMNAAVCDFADSGVFLSLIKGFVLTESNSEYYVNALPKVLSIWHK